MINDQYRLQQDVVSIFTDTKGKPKVYGKKGERVTEVSDCVTVLIVKGSTGERYAALKSSLQKI